MASTDSQAFDGGLYPIGTVSTLTGVNAVTLRAWERRYSLLQPHRTEGGRRLYSPAEVERIRAVLRLLDQGVAISRVAEAMERPGPVAGPDEPWLGYRQEMIAGICDFDETRLERAYAEALALYPIDVVTRQLLLPLLQDLGTRWENGEGSIAEEHFFSVYLRNKLGARFHHRNLRNSGPVIVAACLPDEQHEFGLLLFALAAHARGYRLVLLGANMPLTGLPPVVQRASGRGLVLSGANTADPGQLVQQLANLSTNVRVPVLVGGKVATRYRADLQRAGVVPLGDELVRGMEEVVRLVPPGRPSN